MTIPLGYYDQSYPANLTGGAPVEMAAPDAAERREAGGVMLTVQAGTPGAYEPAVPAGERPRNVTELRERARPATRAAWEAGHYVQVGTSGKRAHWDGEDWRSGEARETGAEHEDDDDPGEQSE